MIGHKFNTRNCGEAIVISRSKKLLKRWRIKFLKTGHEVDVSNWQISSGQILDPYLPLVCGVGIPGEVDRHKYGKLANIWRDIIYRCNDPKNTSYNRYGAKGVSICKEWLFLPKFIEDVITLPGFDWYAFNEGLLHLDKDTTQRFCDKKVYSKDTCVWLTKEENVRIQDGQMRPFKATDKNGNTELYCNISDFARKHSHLGFTRRNVSAILHKRARTCFGWKFEFVDPELLKEIV